MRRIAGAARTAALAVVLLGAAAAEIGAQGMPPTATGDQVRAERDRSAAPADSGRAAPETSATGRAGGRAGRGTGVARSGFFRSPTGIMLRSVAVPGWGQATNGAWLKAAIVAGVEGTLLYLVVRDTGRLGRVAPPDPEYDRVFNRRQRNAWWLGAVVGLSMVDAYVDAQLKEGDVELGPEPSLGPVSLAVRVRLP